MTTIKTKITGTKSTNKKVKTLPKGVNFQARKNTPGKYVARLVITTAKGPAFHNVGAFDTPQAASKARKEYILSLV